MITIIISVFNEMNNPYLSSILNQFKDDPIFEVIYIDGGSTDGTLKYLERNNMTTHICPNSTRAARLNLGIKRANFQHILLHHPRSIITAEGIEFLKKNIEKIKWAAFTHRFDKQHFFLKFISWYSNEVRVKKKEIVYLDHCMIIKKEFLEQNNIPDIAIFEDTALSKIITKKGYKPTLLPYHATTSAIRFLSRGIYKQFLLNQWIKFLYHINVDHKKINKLYEQQLNLNQKNDK
jgi:glycosyltransferase involved in cell wall biosynthesis